MRSMAMMVSGALLLAGGCSDGNSADVAADGSISLDAAAAATANIAKPEAGLYRASITMTGIDVPGMDASMAGHGGGMTTTNEYCLTKDDVAEGYEEMMKRGQDGSCSYERFNVAGGKLDAVMVCQTEQGAARMEMKGKASATSSEFDATMKMDFDGMGTGTMKFSGKHERIGDCS